MALGIGEKSLISLGPTRHGRMLRSIISLSSLRHRNSYLYFVTYIDNQPYLKEGFSRKTNKDSQRWPKQEIFEAKQPKQSLEQRSILP